MINLLDIAAPDYPKEPTSNLSLFFIIIGVIVVVGLVVLLMKNIKSKKK